MVEVGKDDEQLANAIKKSLGSEKDDPQVQSEPPVVPDSAKAKDEEKKAAAADPPAPPKIDDGYVYGTDINLKGDDNLNKLVNYEYNA